MSKFRWAYIGNGSIAASTARSIEKGAHTITAVYGRNEEKAKAFAKKHKAKAYTDFEKCIMADDVDAVYIATPHTSHVDYAYRAMQMGKPVLCEKPVGINLSEVECMINASKEYDVYFCEAMWTWFSKVAMKVKEWVQSGEIGEVTDVVIDYAFPGIMMSKNSRVLTPSTAGGALLDIGIYPITYCYNIFGMPDKIECNGTLKNGIDIAETVVLRYGKMKCTLNMSLCYLKEGCKITGTKGSINIPMFHMASRAVMTQGRKKKTYRGKTNYLIEFTHVADEIKAGKKESDFIPFETTLATMHIMDECRQQMGLVYPSEQAEKTF